MKITIQTILLLALLVNNCWAGLIPEPPPIKDFETRTYLKTLYNHHNNMEIVTSNPNGSRNGKRGDVLLYVGATQSVLTVCVSSPDGTQWLSSPLTVVP